jgi:excisionase family DNA binding protein
MKKRPTATPRSTRRSHDNREDQDRATGTDSRLLTVAQAADISQISERQIRRMIGDGRIPVVRFGRAVRIRPKDLGI